MRLCVRRLGQVEREAEVLRKGVEDKERRLASLVEGDGSHSRALVAQVEMRVREQEANQLQKYDQELALMQRRVITLQETVCAVLCPGMGWSCALRSARRQT